MCIPEGGGEVPTAAVRHDGGRLRRVDGEALQGSALQGDTRSAAGTDGAKT